MKQDSLNKYKTGKIKENIIKFSHNWLFEIEKEKRCRICNLPLKTKSAIGSHLRVHKISISEYYIKYYLSCVTPKCINCGDKVEYDSRVARFKKYCCFNCQNIMTNNPRWSGGKYQTNGYVYTKRKSHPNSNKEGYVAEHRLVIEKKIKRYLKSTEHIHHKNSIRSDNKLNNLEVTNNSDHFKTHKVWLQK